MNILDYVIILIFVFGVIVGLFKGIIRQILTVIGIIVVATLTATVAPYVQNWLSNAIPDDNTRTIVAMIASVLLLVIAYSAFALLIQRILQKISIIKVVDRILGAVIGAAAVYLVFAVIVALFNSTGEDFMPIVKQWLGESFNTSWVATHVYANNFFGDWVIKDIAEKLLNYLQPTP
ncbi:MAG: CvpA family protein [Clostridiales bacterium]|nr:CvpA family protein [Clostridiales bacterium]